MWEYIYKIPENLIWVDRKLVRIFYNDEEKWSANVST